MRLLLVSMTVAVLAALATASAAQSMRPLTAELAYAERMALPPDARIIAEVRDETGGIVNRQRRNADGSQVPLPLRVAVPPDEPLVFQAVILLGGAPHWISPEIEVEAGTDAVDLGQVELGRVQSSGISTTYLCRDVEVEIAYAGSGARMRIGGRYFDLIPDPTGSGARYVALDDRGTWAWTQGEAAEVSVQGQELSECSASIPLPLESVRGGGIEPGWLIELTADILRYTGDYGETEIERPLPIAEIMPDRHLYALPADQFAASFELALCRDAATGMPHPMTVSVRQEERTLRGCGGQPRALLRGADWTVDALFGRDLPAYAGMRLRFRPMGRLGGTSGCNLLEGSYDLSGEGLDLAGAAATDRECAEGVVQREARFYEALGAADRFDIGADGALTLYSGADPVLRAQH